MGEPTNAPAESPESQLARINLETATAQLRKLNLENAALAEENHWYERMTRFIPLVTALISIAGFLWGVYIFQGQQERDRVSREQDRVSRDLSEYRTGCDQLLQFTSNQNMTVARVLALREDLDKLLDGLYPKENTADPNKNAEEARKLRDSINNLISKDFDFTQPRDVYFDFAALQYWQSYRDGLQGDLNAVITEKYLQALADLKTKDPELVHGIRLEDTNEILEPGMTIENPYRSVIEGFVCHLGMLPKAEQEKQRERFSIITNNTALASKLDRIRCPAVTVAVKPPQT